MLHANNHLAAFERQVQLLRSLRLWRRKRFGGDTLRRVISL
jgi:uncharacterized protein YjiS (DUF1127 family)